MTSTTTSITTLKPNVEKHLRAAMAALRLGDMEVAVSEADRARSIDQSPETLIVFAAIAHGLGRDVDALTMLEHAAKLAPSIGNYPDASAAILLKLGRKADGIFNLKLGTHLPQDAFVSEIIGDFFGNVKAIFDSFIENRPLRTAKLMMSQGMYISAFHQLETHISVSGGDSVSFALIAECSLRLGQQLDAKMALAALRALDASYETLPDMELQLAILTGDIVEIKAQYAALPPPSTFAQASERMQAMLASPHFDEIDINAARKAVLDFIHPIDGLDNTNFNLNPDKIIVGFFCENVDPSLENIVFNLKDMVHVKMYILGPIASASQQRLKKAIEDWREVVSVDDATLAEMIRMDDISVLFDCSALSKFSRPSVLRSRVAPIQVLWHRDDGYYDPKSYDYYLANPFSKNLENDSFALILSNPLVYPIPSLEMMGKIVEVREKRASFKKENSHQVRLLAPHTELAVSDALLNCWMDVLLQVPSATLALIARPDINDPYVQKIIAIANDKSVSGQVDLIDPEDFKVSPYDILLEADIVLDSFPRGDRDAVLGALLIGCPVITLAGEKPYEAASPLLVQGGGLADTIAFSETDYKERAIALASSATEREKFNRSLIEMHKNVTLASYQKTAAEIAKKMDALCREWCTVNV